ncbi:hypothetical protein HJC23_005729 [Cyclotella cryptica]|uniref:Peptidase M50 domain-containing protein n=1 Tax=Cyclotella cryptica TaxID=29204 RepID=A0ABD3QCT9_9STRA|eukprot:CCRYP_006444-RA/>CCRYP_006444-RA protein AED:0.17 eAED:0.17 QI:72/0.75/0.6/1/1/1/5/3431/309
MTETAASTATDRPRLCTCSNGSISLGSIRGIPITLHYSFFLLLVLELFISIRYTAYPLFILFIITLYGPVLLLTIIIHELGHAFMTRRLGGVVEGIILWPLGGFALCGPVESLGRIEGGVDGTCDAYSHGFDLVGVSRRVKEGQAGLWPDWTIYLDVLSASAVGFFQTLASEAFYMNLILLGFNLFIPAYPLDGGRIYAASLILVLKLGPVMAAKVTAVTAMLLSVAMVVYAIISFLTGIGGSGLLLGLIGIFIFSNSYDLFASARQNNLGDHPIFGRQCYRGTGGSTGESGGDGPQEVPAQSDSAVIT